MKYVSQGRYLLRTAIMKFEKGLEFLLERKFKRSIPSIGALLAGAAAALMYKKWTDGQKNSSANDPGSNMSSLRLGKSVTQ